MTLPAICLASPLSCTSGFLGVGERTHDIQYGASRIASSLNMYHATTTIKVKSCRRTGSDTRNRDLFFSSFFSSLSVRLESRREGTTILQEESEESKSNTRRKTKSHPKQKETAMFGTVLPCPFGLCSPRDAVCTEYLLSFLFAFFSVFFVFYLLPFVLPFDFAALIVH